MELVQKRVSIIGAWRRPHRSAGYCATLLGSLGGAIVGGAGGLYLGARWADRYVEDAGFDSLGYWFGGMFVGAWLGGVVGAFIALRLRRHRRAGTTAAAVALLLPGAALAEFWLVPERFWPCVGLVAPLLARRVGLIGARATDRARSCDEPCGSPSDRRLSSGYGAVLIGSLVGAIPLAFAGGLLGLWYYNYRTPDAEAWGAVAGLLFGLFAGAWIGGIVGSYIGLRVRRHRAAGTTFIVAALVEMVLAGLASRPSSDTPTPLGLATLWAMPLVAPLMARAVYIGIVRRRPDH